ncbi:MAG: hypothetical protein AB7F43_06965 [Bacteriovoracia bacterium]
MKTLFLLSISVISLLSCTQEAEARIVYYGSETETLSVAYGGPTILRFDEEVKTISQAARFTIEPADATQPDYKVLSITPRFPSGSSNIAFILASGQVVNTKAIIVSSSLPEKVDSFYDFRPKDKLLDQLDKSDKTAKISELELMKSMIKWEQVVDYNLRKLIRTVPSGIDDLSIQLIRVYTGAEYNGYIFKLVNNSKHRSYSINLKDLVLGTPNMAILSQIDRNVLKSEATKENTAYLRIVAKPASIYYSVNLPFEKLEEKK